MEYRTLGKTGLEVSAIGLGTEHLQSDSREAMDRLVGTAVDAGLTYIDLLWDDPEQWRQFGPALVAHRDRFVLAVHWGGDINQPELCRRNFEVALARLGNDYAEVGLITMVDTAIKWQGAAQQAIEELQRLKEQGRIAAIGASSHRAPIALKMVESGLIDVLMFPVNLFADTNDAAKAVHRACAERGVGLVAMKPYSGGQVFVSAPDITTTQCLAYVLAQPVSTTVPGAKNAQELQAALHYCTASDAEKDYGQVLAHAQRYIVGDCVYCDHCLPCPQGIDVGQMIQIADTARFFPPDEIRAEYAAITARASDCIECGECMARCPFDVDVVAKMRGAVTFFGC